MIKHLVFNHLLVRLSGLIFGLIIQTNVFAANQIIPQVSSGAIQQRQKQSEEVIKRKLHKKPSLGPLLIGPRIPGKTVILDKGPYFKLKKIDVNPSHFIKKKQIENILAKFLNRSISIADLYKIVDRINVLYAQRGLITCRAILPAQKIKHQSVRIQLIEGKVDKIKIVNSHYTDKQFILSRLGIKPGEVFNPPKLTQKLESFNAINHLGLTASLKSGSQFGTTDVLLHAYEPKRLQTYLLFNNEGSDSTGRNQAGVYAVVNGPARKGDRLTLYILKSEGNLNGNLGYQIPISKKGLMLSLSYAHSQLKINNGPFTQLNITGSSNEGQIGLNYPIRKNKKWLFHLGGELSFLDSITNVGGFPLSHNQILESVIKADFQYMGTQFSWQGSNQFKYGTSKNVLNEDSNYSILTGQMQSAYTLSSHWLNHLRLGYQMTPNQVLPPSQQFQLGGVNTIKGYVEGAVSGLQGFFVEGALGYRLLKQMKIKTFGDYGSVYSTTPKNIMLSSVGLKLEGVLPKWHQTQNSTWSLIMAHPLTILATDQKSNRFYFNLVMPF